MMDSMIDSMVYPGTTNAFSGGPNGVSRPFLAKGSAAPGPGGDWEYLLAIHADGGVSFRLLNLEGTVAYAEPKGGLLSVGEWHHVAGTMKKGVFARVFLDGVVAEQTTFPNVETRNGSSVVFS